MAYEKALVLIRNFIVYWQGTFCRLLVTNIYVNQRWETRVIFLWWLGNRVIYQQQLTKTLYIRKWNTVVNGIQNKMLIKLN